VTAGRGFRDPKVLFAFVLIILIWGSTWIVIKDQLGVVPSAWSVTYRFAIACAAMFAFAWWSGAALRMNGGGHALTALFGVPQFVLNFNFVYAAEHYVTSGLVAVVFALLMVPNSAQARRARATRRSASVSACSPSSPPRRPTSCRRARRCRPVRSRQISPGACSTA
jgi:hypothetical protein